jgi:glycogen synthase
VLRHPPLARTLREHGSFEVRRLSWGDAAKACLGIYDEAKHAVNGHV